MILEVVHLRQFRSSRRLLANDQIDGGSRSNVAILLKRGWTSISGLRRWPIRDCECRVGAAGGDLQTAFRRGAQRRNGTSRRAAKVISARLAKLTPGRGLDGGHG